MPQAYSPKFVRGLLATAFIIALFFATGCGISESKSAAEKKAESLYTSLANSDDEAAFKLYAPAFHATGSEQESRKMIQGVRAIIGDYKGHKLQTWNFKNTVGADGNVKAIVLVYLVDYTNSQVTETLTFFSSASGESVDLVGHHFDSPEIRSAFQKSIENL